MGIKDTLFKFQIGVLWAELILWVILCLDVFGVF